MTRSIIKFLILGAMLLGLPILGVIAAGYPIARYLEFPPETRYVSKTPFSWIMFTGTTLAILCFVLPLLAWGIRSFRLFRGKTPVVSSYPWWGWLGIFSGATVWILAWTRFSWFSNLQPHTFAPLWLSYILVINALKYRNTGHCMITHRTRFFLMLFPVGAMFWWFFEYLNRFVQSWLYVDNNYSPSQYFWLATVSFSTALPAVLGTRDWLWSISWIKNGFSGLPAIRFNNPRLTAWLVLIVSGIGLFDIAIFPNFLFPLLWVFPLLIIVSLQVLMEDEHIFKGIAEGNWSFLVASALAAVFCGFFWEMWNFHSMAKWFYEVPWVHKFLVFEMPILGYAGYLTFGLECAVIGNLVNGKRFHP